MSITSSSRPPRDPRRGASGRRRRGRALRRGAELPEQLRTGEGYRVWLREAKHQLEEQRAQEARPVPRNRGKRLKEAKRRLDEELWTETRANRAYEHYRSGRMKDGRRFSRPPDPYTPPATPQGQNNITDPDSHVVKGSRGRGSCRVTTPRLLHALAGRLHRRPDDPDIQDACSEAWTTAMRAPGAPLHDPDHQAGWLTVTAARADFHAYKGTENRSVLALGVSVLIACPGASDT